MDRVRFEKIQSIFHHAVACPEPERGALLHAACGDDAELMAEVTAMLDADSRAGSLLDRGLPEVACGILRENSASPSIHEFGPYRLKEMLGEGGMGVVWLAERQDAGNLVAIKFLLHAGLSPVRRERFTREIKTLGKLKHAFIAPLYDAGTLSDGTPWFVMEYVRGRRFLEYCRITAATTRQRLLLFRKVLEAVHYAHGQEIIHRDLKPSNILVAADGTPRLLDFGIARELQNPFEPAEQTRPGLRFLSPDYAAPEWVRDGTVGFYTDVYSLGVILYELLAGHLPSDRSNPSALATVVSAGAGLGERLPKSAWRDLDALCCKAMHADPRQRYPSVEAFIRDIDHYLNAEPLESRRATIGYRLDKFVKRNRHAVSAAALVFVLIVALVVFFTVRLAKARDAALAEAARTRRIQAFMLDLFGSGDKLAAPSKELRVVDLLDRGVRESAALTADPETQAELYQSLGNMYTMLGKNQQAEDLLRLAIQKMDLAHGQGSPKVTDLLVQLGVEQNGLGHFRQAEQYVREGLRIAGQRLPPDDPVVLRAQSALGMVMADSGSYQKAEAVLEPLVKRQFGPDRTYTLTALAAAESHTGRPDLAESLDREALALDQKLHGPSHPRVAFDLSELGTLEANRGEFQQAEQHYRQALAINQAWYGAGHPDTVLSATLVAMVLIQEGQNDVAAGLLKNALPAVDPDLSSREPRMAVAFDTLGTLMLKKGDLGAAEQNYRRALAMRAALFGDNNHQTAMSKAHLAQVYIARHQDRQAEPLLREALQAQSEPPQPGNLSVGALESLLGALLVRQKHYAEAEPYLTAACVSLGTQPKTYAKRLQEARDALAAAHRALHRGDPADSGRR